MGFTALSTYVIEVDGTVGLICCVALVQTRIGEDLLYGARDGTLTLLLGIQKFFGAILARRWNNPHDTVCFPTAGLTIYEIKEK